MDTLTQKQKDILLKFKERLKDVAKPEYDDRFYSRWLLARDFDLKKAETMFREHLVWRRKYDIDSILEWQAPEILRNCYPTGFHGEAKDGTPVYFFLVGRIDGKSLYYNARKQDFLKKMARNFTYLDKVLGPEQSKNHGKVIDQMTTIKDFEGMGMDMLFKPFMDLGREIIRASDDNFPERLRRAILINLPRFFPIIWNFVKPILSKRTTEKVIILGSNWRHEILEYIDADQLPIHYGGTCPDPPSIPETDYSFCWGGKVPDRYKNAKPELDLSKFSQETVTHGRSYSHEVEITMPGSILEWQFWTEDHDIGFSLHRKIENPQNKKEDKEVIISGERVNSHILPEDGRITCDVTGTYVVIFDNSYSWARAKKVMYSINVFEPNDLQDIQVNTDSFDTHM